MGIFNRLNEEKRDKLLLVIIQLLISVTLIGVGLYNCTVNGINPLWVSLIVFPVSVFLPHPEHPVFPTWDAEDSDQDQVDGPTPESISRSHCYRNRRLVFICHFLICITLTIVGICGLIAQKRLRALSVGLIAFGCGCLLPTPFILLREPTNGVCRSPTHS